MILKMLFDRTTSYEYYVSEDGSVVMKRDYDGASPSGNYFNGRWVLRRNGDYIDHDKYRYDLATRHGFELST